MKIYENYPIFSLKMQENDRVQHHFLKNYLICAYSKRMEAVRIKSVQRERVVFMSEVFYQPKGGWVGDTIPFAHNGKFYIFYLHDERKGHTEDEYGYRTSWNLLITEDGVHFEDRGVVLPVGGYEDADYACYTGSVIAGKDGRFHLFYTAQNNYNPRYHRDGRPLQFVAHATSEDLIHWEKDPKARFGADERIYEPFDWRDPFVFYNEEEECYNMLLAARLQGAGDKNGGCVGLCRSKDLIHWQAAEPFYHPESYMTHECPDLFRMGNKWYLVYSTFSEKFVTHYRMSDSLGGPWTAPVEDTFDGRAFYAAKTAKAHGHRWAFAWVPTRRGESDFGQYEWGGSLLIHQLKQEVDGRLTVSPPEAVQETFAERVIRCELITAKRGEEPLIEGQESLPEQGRTELPESPPIEGQENSIFSKLELHNVEGKKNLIFDGMEETCMMEADLIYEEGTRAFGLAVRQDEKLERGYYFRLEPFYNRVVADMWPRRVAGVNQWYIDGDKAFMVELERPFDFSRLPKRRLHLRLIAEGSILCLYVNESLALTMRAYESRRSYWGFFVDDGGIQVENVRLTARNIHSETNERRREC